MPAYARAGGSSKDCGIKPSWRHSATLRISPLRMVRLTRSTAVTSPSELPRLDGGRSFSLRVVRQGFEARPLASAPGRRQGHEDRFHAPSPGPLPELRRTAAGEHPPGVHDRKVFETVRFFQLTAHLRRHPQQGMGRKTRFF